jgi:hypothetical protein
MLINFQKKIEVVRDFPGKFQAEFEKLANHTGASAPGTLSRVTLQEAVEYWSEKYYSQFQLLPLFSEDVVDSIDVMWEQVTHLLKLGSFRTGPEKAERVDLERFAQHMTRVIFQAYSYDLESLQAVLLRDPGQPLGYAGQLSLANAKKKLTEAQRRRIELYWRTVHFMCSQFLQGETTLTSPVSGATATLTSGITVEDASANWATPGTNIINDFAEFLVDFRELNGGLSPTHIIVNHRFHNDFLLQNEELRETFAPQMPSIMRGTIDPLMILSERLDFSPKIIKMAEMYDTGVDPALDGTMAGKAHVWDRNIMTFVLDVPGEDNLKLLTARTLDNDMAGGIAMDTEETKDPKRMSVIISGNHIPQIRDPRRVVAYNLNP